MACAFSVDQIRNTWKPVEIAAVVLGFVVFWPLGLAILVWKLWKDRYGTPSFSFDSFDFTRWQAAPSGNTAFEAYKRETLDRLERERRKLQEEERAFAEFLKELRRAKDQEEFDRFMAARHQAG